MPLSVFWTTVPPELGSFEPRLGTVALESGVLFVAEAGLKAALDAKGRPTAWLQRSAFPPIGFTMAPNQTYGGAGEMGMGWADMPFDIPNLRVASTTAW